MDKKSKASHDFDEKRKTRPLEAIKGFPRPTERADERQAPHKADEAVANKPTKPPPVSHDELVDALGDTVKRLHEDGKRDEPHTMRLKELHDRAEAHKGHK